MASIHNTHYPNKHEQFDLDFYIQQVGLYPDLNYVACDSSGKVVGYILACVDYDGNGHVTDFTIVKEHRNKKLGKKLMSATLVEMTEAKLQYCKLHVHVTNETALYVYRDVFDFNQEGLIQDYYGSEKDAYQMSKRLDVLEL